MEKHCVILENDQNLSSGRNDFVLAFLKRYEGRSTILTSLKARTSEEIYSAVSTATDIAVQSTFAYGAEYQLHSMVKLLSKIPHTINIHMYYVGLNDTLYEFLIKELTPSELISIEHHKLLEFHELYTYEDTPHIVLDFKVFTQAYKDKIQYETLYKESARSRPTGQKVKLLGCNAFGTAFNNLPLGQVVDVLDNSEQDTRHNRGVWIWGNCEPIKLVNDCGVIEYETQVTSIDDLRFHLISSYPQLHKDNNFALDGLLSYLPDESALSIANAICDEFGIEKRVNRQHIVSMINQLEIKIA